MARAQVHTAVLTLCTFQKFHEFDQQARMLVPWSLSQANDGHYLSGKSAAVPMIVHVDSSIDKNERNNHAVVSQVAERRLQP